MSIDYSAATQLSPSGTIVLVITVNLLLLAAFVNALYSATRHGRRARDAAASVSNAEPRSAGPVVLSGTVETEDPQRPAVVVTVQERGEQREHKGRWSHSWTEFDRQVQVEPFDLVLASGTRVRVEPDPDVFLVDKLEITRRGNPRTRKACLENGEIAYVDGVLASGWHPRRNAADAAPGGDGLYRGGRPTGLVLTNGVERMLISTEPLALRHRRRSHAHRTAAIVLGLALLLMNTLMFGSTHLVNALGDVVQTRVVAKSSWITVHKGTRTTHYGVRASYIDRNTGRQIEVDDEVSHLAYVAATRGEPIPFRVVLRWPSLFNVGTGATVGPLRVALSVLIVSMLLAANVIKVRGTREWFDRDIIVEHGKGELQI